MKKLLIILIIAGLFIRNLYTFQNAITFGYDQARDLIISQEIFNGDFKIQGPSANAPGLNHGVLYFYFLAIPYLLGEGNPVITAIWLSIFNTLTILLVFYLAYILTKDKLASIVAAVVFTFSYEASQYALWLSNPSMAVWFVPLIYLCLWLWTVKSKSLYAILTGLFLGLSIQSDLFLVYHVFPVAAWILINRKHFEFTTVAKSIFGLILGVLTLILSEIKFGFQGINGLVYLFTGGDKIASSKNIFDFIFIYFSQLQKLFTNNLYPTSLTVGAVIMVVLILWLVTTISEVKTERPNYKLFLILFLFAHLPVVPLGGLNSPYLTVGLGSAACIIAGLFISQLYRKSKIVALGLLIIVVVSNITMILRENKKGQTIFSTRPAMLLSNLINAVDYTYVSSNGEKISIDTVTAPLWLNTTWSAVYNIYGVKKYGFLPFWHGKDQVGYWGDNLEKTPKEVRNYYLIIEPHAGIPEKFIEYAINDENYKSSLIEEKDFGGITVQKRKKIL